MVISIDGHLDHQQFLLEQYDWSITEKVGSSSRKFFTTALEMLPPFPRNGFGDVMTSPFERRAITEFTGRYSPQLLPHESAFLEFWLRRRLNLHARHTGSFAPYDYLANKFTMRTD